MDIKFYNETRNEKIEAMETMKNTIVEEKRAFTAEENEQFNSLLSEVEAIDQTINNLSKTMEVCPMNTEIRNAIDTEVESQEVREIREFASFIRESRSNVDFTKSDNGEIIPETIAKKIISKVYEISPIVGRANIYTVKGKLVIPVYTETTTTAEINVAYATEFTELESNVGQMTSVELTGYLAGALVRVSKSLLNNTDFDIVSFIIDKMAEAIARFLDKEILNPADANHIVGLSGATQSQTTASSSAITADELIETQAKLPSLAHDGAFWIMNKATLSYIRKLKDGENRYLLNPDFTQEFGYQLLGRPVYLSDAMPVIAAGATVAYYVNPKGVALKMANSVEMDVLRERYAAMHAVGVCAFVEADCKIENQQMVSKLVMKS